MHDPALAFSSDDAEASPPAVPRVPESIADTGLSAGMISDLLIRTLYVQGARTGAQLRRVLGLPFSLLDEELLSLQQRRYVQVRGAGSHGRSTYTFELTAEGRDRAREVMEVNQYVGPAPVPLAEYERWVATQTIRRVRVTKEVIHDGFSHLVFDDQFLDQLGPAINSGKSLFLYGHAGNGKTTIAEAIARMMGGSLYLPYALEIEGQIAVLYDPVYHHPLDGTEEDDDGDDLTFLRDSPKHDMRYALIKRPVVFAGGELTLDQLELQYDAQTKVYQAPAHVKANGGVFIIDDFGRQLVRPRDLLNRWMIPLEKHLDYLAFRSGHKFPVPFDTLIVFATNLNPLELVDEAFLRRIRYKILVESPSYEQYKEIFRRCCQARDILFDPDRVRYIYQQYYERLEIPPRGCHPRDLVDTLCNVAKYLEVEASLTIDLLDRACKSYFLDMPGGGASHLTEPQTFDG
ncbi:MAG: ATP-binding protein [Gemmatimonadota bacterium]